MAENEVPVLSQTKLSALPNSPFPTRILKLIRDEEEWLSESELKTDNSSSSDDEMSPTSQNLKKKFNKIKKRRKSKVSFKESADKKDDVNNIRSSKSRPKHSVSSLNENLSGQLLRGTGDGKSSSLLSTSIAESDEDDNEIYWRPKRGSISLTGLVNEISNISISDTK